MHKPTHLSTTPTNKSPKHQSHLSTCIPSPIQPHHPPISLLSKSEIPNTTSHHPIPPNTTQHNNYLPVLTITQSHSHHTYRHTHTSSQAISHPSAIITPTNAWQRLSLPCHALPCLAAPHCLALHCAYTSIQEMIPIRVRALRHQNHDK